MTSKRFFAGRALAALAISVHFGLASAEPQNGWWWNPSESGRGFFIEERNGLIYLGGYFYEDNGRATWLTSGGPLTDPYLYQGTLQRYQNGQSVFGAYRPPGPAVDVGPVTLKFTDDSHGTLTWPGGTVPIERQIFDEEEPIPAAVFALFDPPFRPLSGWWWNEAESGTGFSLEVRGNNLFVVAFMYDDAGLPIWYFTAGPMSSPTHYEGDWLLFADGQTMTGPYRPPSTPQKLGRVIVDFSAEDEGTIAYTDSTAAKEANAPKVRSRLITIRGNQLGPNNRWPYSAHWPKWTGGVDILNTLISPTTRLEESLTFGVTYDLQPPQAPGRVTYDLNPNSTLTYHFLFRDTETGCEQKGDMVIPGPLTGLLTVRDNLTYVGSVGPASVVQVPVTETCVDPSNGSVRTSRLADRIVGGSVEFGGSQAFGGISRISRFYPYYALQPTNPRPPPLMHGIEPYRADPDFFLEWTLVAP